ncbi:hypothetical protein [Aquimarina pacifica]|uniref:hypothetical protein n=1 Tax=Aquimarina pacifica TaxID=1296415 RepID=UPI0004B570D5|nr:hypothetical protein [Aquimarina pacifica]
MKYIYSKIFIIFCLGLILACQGEEGADGIDGIDGIDGANGEDGVDGVDAENLDSYDAFTQYGSILLTLEGTRADDVAFTENAEFKFTATSPDNSWSGDPINVVSVGETETEFDVIRFLSTPNGDVNQSSVSIDFVTINPGEETETYEFALAISNYAVIGEDLKIFVINDTYEDTDGDISNFEITNYSFDDATNNFVFSFSFDVAADSNVTGNDLSISGEVNITVLEAYEAPAP